MAPKLRQTGLSILGDVPWGMHLCIFYETSQDLLDTLIPYFHAGLQDNEFVIWAVSDPLTVEEAHAAMARGIPDYQRHLSRGQVEIVAGSEWYLGRDLKKVTEGWHEKLDAALANGFTGLRVSGNAFWLETRYRDDFLAYEQGLDESLAGCPVLVLCSYPLLSARAVDILDVARAHQLTVARRSGQWEFIQPAGAPSGHSLTQREVEVLTWVARGRSALESAKALGISKRTVDAHVQSAMQKLGASNRAEVVALAVRHHIVELDPSGRPARRRESTIPKNMPRT
jgi:DNA-binding CsgD family transcriptional regulator